MGTAIKEAESSTKSKRRVLAQMGEGSVPRSFEEDEVDQV
jgi:hypothetical protein